MPTHVYRDLEPRELWRHFAELNDRPRPSRQEALAREYVLQQAASVGAAALQDARGSVVVHVPATPGRETAPVVAVQAHLDMVCEKRPEVEHNFATDPIRPRMQDGWVYATGTTLGADNGIGASAALALLTDSSVPHGPLDLIFTVEEEIGLNGAAALDPTAIRAKMLVNLDSENPREVIIGCARNGGAILRLAVKAERTPARATGWEIKVSGLRGGHSGVQIHERRANAIKVLVTALEAARAAGVQFRLVSVRGGKAHNAIPRDATAVVTVSPEQEAALHAAVAATQREAGAAWGADEPGLTLDLTQIDPARTVLKAADADRVLRVLSALPHGVIKMSDIFEGKVESSSNLAQVDTADGCVTVATSTRSFVNRELDAVQARIAEIGRAAGAKVEVRDGYPAWEPNADSELVRLTAAAYSRVFGEPPDINVIHAGLECGVIAAKVPGMDAVSFGPRIEDAHTPEERVEPGTVANTWRLLCELLRSVSETAA